LDGSTVATSGSANTGGGGGGSGGDGVNYFAGGAGGKGVVIFRYPTDAARGRSVTGGTISTSGIYTIHTFNDTGSLVVA
jgi:hypothetical protein